MQSRMEMIYVGKGSQAYKTGYGAIFDTNEQTWSAFKSAKPLAIPLDKAEFLLDYYNAKGGLSDTIGLDRAGFERIVGVKARGPATYAKRDASFWKKLAQNAA